MDFNVWAVFTTGLLTGGLTCVAVQGGVLTAALVQRQELRTKNQELRTTIIPVVAFIVAKLIAYTILGFFLGWLGSMLQINLQTRIILQLAVVIFMLGTALNLLNIHPFFRYFVIHAPSWLIKSVYKKSDGGGFFAPFFLGFSTVLIPCGATQAMMALAIGTGQPVWGALVMFAFVLGTAPVFLLLGLVTIRLRALFNRRFSRIAAFVLIFFAFFNLDATLALSGSSHTLRSLLNKGFCVISYCESGLSSQPVSEQTIIFSPTGYTPNKFAVRAGDEITLNLVNKDASGCIQAFTIARLNIQKIVLPETAETITFRAPETPGPINFTCSSGFYPGIIEVI
jgi:uncharacterized protein